MSASDFLNVLVRPAIGPMTLSPIEHRYHSDPTCRKVVDSLRLLLLTQDFTTAELHETVDLAAEHLREQRRRIKVEIDSP